MWSIVVAPFALAGRSGTGAAGEGRVWFGRVARTPAACGRQRSTGAPRPDLQRAFGWQVSWLTGRHRPIRLPNDPTIPVGGVSGTVDRQLTAYSCGGSPGFSPDSLNRPRPWRDIHPIKPSRRTPCPTERQAPDRGSYRAVLVERRTDMIGGPLITGATVRAPPIETDRLWLRQAASDGFLHIGPTKSPQNIAIRQRPPNHRGAGLISHPGFGPCQQVKRRPIWCSGGKTRPCTLLIPVNG